MTDEDWNTFPEIDLEQAELWVKVLIDSLLSEYGWIPANGI